MAGSEAMTGNATNPRICESFLSSFEDTIGSSVYMQSCVCVATPLEVVVAYSYLLCTASHGILG